MSRNNNGKSAKDYVPIENDEEAQLLVRRMSEKPIDPKSTSSNSLSQCSAFMSGPGILCLPDTEIHPTTAVVMTTGTASVAGGVVPTITATTPLLSKSRKASYNTNSSNSNSNNSLASLTAEEKEEKEDIEATAALLAEATKNDNIKNDKKDSGNSNGTNNSSRNNSGAHMKGGIIARTSPPMATTTCLDVCPITTFEGDVMAREEYEMRLIQIAGLFRIHRDYEDEDANLENAPDAQKMFVQRLRIRFFNLGLVSGASLQ
jgi:hypothetical protein